MNTNYQIAPFFAEPFFVIPDFLDHDLRQILIRKVKKFSKKWEGQGKNVWASATKSPSNSFHLDENLMDFDIHLRYFLIQIYYA